MGSSQRYEGRNQENIQRDFNKLTRSTDAIEQEFKSRNVVVFGIPELNNDENVKQKLTSLANDVLEMRDSKQADIETTYRIGRGSS